MKRNFRASKDRRCHAEFHPSQPLFGAPQQIRDRIRNRWQEARLRLGSMDPVVLRLASWLCVSHGLEPHSLVSREVMAQALDVFEADGAGTGNVLAARDYALNLAGQAAMLRYAGNLESASRLANFAYLMLEELREVHFADIVRVAQLGALCWLGRGGVDQTLRALDCVEAKVQALKARHPAIAVQHERIRRLAVQADLSIDQVWRFRPEPVVGAGGAS